MPDVGFHPILEQGEQGDPGPPGPAGDPGDSSETFHRPASVVAGSGIISSTSTSTWWTQGSDWSPTNGSTPSEGAPLAYRRRHATIEFRGAIVAGRGTEIFRLPQFFRPAASEDSVLTGPWDDYDIGFVGGQMTDGTGNRCYPAIAVNVAAGTSEPCVILIRPDGRVSRQGGSSSDRLIVGWENVRFHTGYVTGPKRSPFPGRSLGYDDPLTRDGLPQVVPERPWTRPQADGFSLLPSGQSSE